MLDPAARGRLRIERLARPEDRQAALARDVRAGLGAPRKRLPPKYFYDARGSELFDRICETPEYYLTRAEQAILDRAAESLLGETRPTDLVELGSGSARKTRTLLDAALRLRPRLRYVPLDLSESALSASAIALLSDFPGLSVHGIVGDLERHLSAIPAGERRTFLFLGSTIGNFEDPEAIVFLGQLVRSFGRDDRLLIGFDLVKDRRRLEAAYNDAQGVTAAFNRNVLHVLNRELDADFVPEALEHVAFYDEPGARIEMHLRAPTAQRASVRALGLEVRLAAGETIHTEISRKFTRATAERLLGGAGLSILRWELSPGSEFALALAGRAG